MSLFVSTVELRKQLQVILVGRENPTAWRQKAASVTFIFPRKKAVASFLLFSQSENTDISNTHTLTEMLFRCSWSTNIFHCHALWFSIQKKRVIERKTKVWAPGFSYMSSVDVVRISETGCGKQLDHRKHQSAIYSFKGELLYYLAATSGK